LASWVDVPVERVERLIHLVRGEKVLLDSDLSLLYGVETKALNKAGKRNHRRFPPDFMFQLTADEARALRFQIGTSKAGRGGEINAASTSSESPACRASAHPSSRPSRR
jgi:hypothetical protein